MRSPSYAPFLRAYLAKELNSLAGDPQPNSPGRAAGHHTAWCGGRLDIYGVRLLRLLRSGSANWVWRADEASAFAPLDELAPGHTLVIPTAHHANVFETPTNVLAAVMELVQAVASAMRASLDAGGVDILSATGAGSEQSVPHLHFMSCRDGPTMAFLPGPHSDRGTTLPVTRSSVWRRRWQVGGRTADFGLIRFGAYCCVMVVGSRPPRWAG